MMSDADACVNDALVADDFDTDSYVEPPPAPRKGGRRLPPLTGHALCDLDREEVDFLFAQRPVRTKTGLRPEFFPGKRFSIGADGRKAKLAYNVSGWFRSTVYLICDVDSLHAAFERVRTCADTDGEPSYVVSGDLAPEASPASAPRSKHASSTAAGRRRPRGLVDASRFWLVLDLDKIPNSLGLDPRQGDDARAAVVAYLRGLLPDELRYGRCSWQLSSSSCVFGPDGLPLPADTPPARLGAHLRYWLDTGLDEGERRRLLQRIGEHVRAQMASRGLESGAGASVDPATATFNQAIFTCASFEGSLQDPLPVRSGLACGTPEVLVGVLEGQLPALPSKVRAVRAPPTDAERLAQKARRQHDSLLRSAARGHAPAPAPRPRLPTPTPAPDPVRGVRLRRLARSQGPQHRVLHASRVGKLQDIVALTDDRRTRLPAWRYGVPEGMRRRTMLVVAGLLSHLVSAAELRPAIQAYGEHLIHADWLEEEWHATKQDAGIVEKAWMAEAAEQAGHDSSGLREDPWLERVVGLMQPTYDEMIRLRLRSLRTDAARKELARRAAGKPTLDERRERAETASEAATRPWEAMGVSEATYRRRKRTARQQAAVAAVDPTQARLTDRGLADVLAYVRLAADPRDTVALTQLAQGPLSAAAVDVAAAAVDMARRTLDVSDVSKELFARAASYHSKAAAEAGGILLVLYDVWRYTEDTARIVDWVLTGVPGYLAWAHEHDHGERLHSVADLLVAAEQHPRPYDFLEARQTCSDAPPAASTGQVDTEVKRPAARAWPGVQEAGCSRATWFRRQKETGKAVAHVAVADTRQGYHHMRNSGPPPGAMW